jgi:TusA-related sulfurtransferase
MESPAPSVNISASTNDGEVDKAPHEPLDSRLVSISINKTSRVWQYFTMVKDGPITRNKIQYVYCCLLCLKKCPHKFLDSLVAIYNDTTGNVHKHITSRHPSLHPARKHQSLEPKQLILILTSTSVSTNNIRAFIKNGNDVVIERIHALVARLVINCKAPLSLATNVNLNEVI